MTAGRKKGANKVEIFKIQKMALGGIDPNTNEEIPPLTAEQIGQALSIEDDVVRMFLSPPKQKRGRRQESDP